MEPQKSTVVIEPLAFVSIVLHAVKHKTKAVHGVLLGSYDSTSDSLKICDAVPVCHDTPTQPLVETALSLVKQKCDDSVTMLGWYTAPMILSDESPGPVALRIMHSFEADKVQPVLLVFQNESLSPILSGEAIKPEAVFKALGKNFGGQWLHPLTSSLKDLENACDTAKKIHASNLIVNDLVDHFDDDPSSQWYPNETLRSHLEKQSEDLI